MTAAVDPNCGTPVAITPTALGADHGGTRYFCGEGCRRSFVADSLAAAASAR